MTSLAPIPLPLPGSLLDILLRLAPLDVLLFDTQLVCRYAALTDGTLLGHTTDQLIGQPATAIFPPDQSDLHAALDLAVRAAVPSSYPTYRLALPGALPSTETAPVTAPPQDPPPHTLEPPPDTGPGTGIDPAASTGTTDTLVYCWAVRVQPVTFLDYQGREEFHGVLVTLADVRDLADDNDQLRQDNDALRRETTELRQALMSAQHREATARRALQATVRSLLAPVVGYLQLVARRPHQLTQRSVTLGELLSDRLLPQLQRVVDTVDTFSGTAPPVLPSGEPERGPR